MKNKILIVGGAGYIGAHTNKLLTQKGYETVVFDNLSTGYRDFVKWGDFYHGDLANKDHLEACFSKHKIKTVMHFGAFANVSESCTAPGKYYSNNVANTLQLLETMCTHDVFSFIFSSSCATYGIPTKIPIDESCPQNPINPYGRTKLMVETILKDYETAYGIKHVNLRYFNAAGADPDSDIGERHDPETHLIPLVIQAALGKRPDVKIFGADYPTPDGSCIRDYIHVTDLALAHVLAMEYLDSGDPSDSFNLGSGAGYSVKEIIDGIARISGKKIKTVVTERRPGDPPVLLSANQKARSVLGWGPTQSSLDHIIETALGWHQKNQESPIPPF